MPANTYGRQVVEALTNKSGGGVIAGDVVIIDTSNDTAFTTTTSAGYTGLIGVAQETIANNATGRVLTAGYAALINVNASVTRGHFASTHTVVKQAAGGSSRTAGTFAQFLTGGTTPTGHLFGIADGSSVSGSITRTTQGTTSAGASFATRGMYLKKLTLATGGNVAAIHAFIKGNGTNNILCAPVVYSDVAGAPTNLLYSPNPVITDTPVLTFPMRLNTTVRDLSMPGPGWLAAGDYWFGIWMSDSTGSASSLANTATGGTGATVAGGTQNQPMDSSLQAITTNSVDYSIYIDVLR